MTKFDKLSIRTFGMLLLAFLILFLCAVSLDYMLISSRGGGESVIGLVDGRFETGERALTLSAISLLGASLLLWIMRDLYRMKGVFRPLFKDIRQEVLEKSGIDEGPDSSGIFSLSFKDIRRRISKEARLHDETDSDKQPVNIEKATRTILFRGFLFHLLIFVPFWFFAFRSTTADPEIFQLINILVSATLWFSFSLTLFFVRHFLLKLWSNTIVSSGLYIYIYIFIIMWALNLGRLTVFILF